MAYAYVYIVASKRYGTLYVGVTTDLVKRAFEHGRSAVEGFTKTYRVHRLVWLEEHDSILEAIVREKRIKGWHRDWKVNLIQSMNPDWVDLFPEIVR